VNLRRRYACLLACVACVCLACGSSSVAPSTPSAPAVTPSIAATDTLPVVTATPTPSPSATPTPLVLAWTTKAVAMNGKASDDSAAQVHLGANFPLTLTGQSATVEGKDWYEATWSTPGRQSTGWLPASAVTRIKPSGIANAAVDALDQALADYLRGLGARVGVDAYDVTRGVTYTYNSGLAYFCASSMKVPIMLTFLTQLEKTRHEPTKGELGQLQNMIEQSDNHAAEALYEKIGAQAGINAFMKGVHLSGLLPNKPGWWGHSTIKPSTMVALLTKLNNGTVLNAAHRKLALELMRHVSADGRIGVGDSSPAGATIAMKDGWTTARDGTGTMVVNTSGIVTLGAETYILSVYTNHDHGYPEGWAIIRHVAKVVGQKLMPTP